MADDLNQDQRLSRPEVKLGETPRNTTLAYSLRHHFGDILRYIYFMRFSLLIWFSMLMLAWADLFHGAAKITRGILTPFSPTQWAFAAFAVILPGWFALLGARIVCAYGADRFDTPPPPCFCVHQRMEWFVFWGSQLPGLTLLGRIAYNSVHEGEGCYLTVYTCLTAGAFAALVFWHLIAILYYWNYDPDSAIPARAFLVPKWSRIPLDEIESLPATGSIRLFHRLLQHLALLGPGYESNVAVGSESKLERQVSPGHLVAAIALICSILLYLLLMPIAAPISVPHLALGMRLLAFGFAIYVAGEFLYPSLSHLVLQKTSARARWLPLLASLIMFSLLLMAASQPSLPRAIPVIAYVAILLIVVFWTLAGIAFFADRFRLPVLTLTAAIVLILNHWPAEHVFRVQPMNDAFDHEPLPDPADFVKRIAFAGRDDSRPVIIISATGGGIHAAAWTATVLRELDLAFGDLEFHNHILLMSTVSGGSVATAGFLPEYFASNGFSPATYERLQGAAACSSLQAVAWGLAYPDTIRLLFPWLFNIVPSLDRFDRGWALEKAIQRNLLDPYCVGSGSHGASAHDPENLTLNALARLSKTLPPNLDPHDPRTHFPAFTFNTTVVETGDRFLLSNYSVFADTSGIYQLLPAASFLGVYGRETTLPLLNPKDVPLRGGFADLSLLTAARLSASFTYASPATRLPFNMSQGSEKNAYHFVDGGYYDNDGTSSVIEFLEAASTAFSSKHPLRVLLIEIRNTDDIDINDSPDSYANQARLKWKKGNWKSDEAKTRYRFGPIEQILAPPETTVYAGFSSVTRRNRRELDTLQRALCGSLELKPITIDYQRHVFHTLGTTEVNKGESEVDQPLSWHLTKRQKDWIESGSDNALDRKKMIFDNALHPKETSDRIQIKEAVDWFRDALQQEGSPLKGGGCQAGMFPSIVTTR